MVIVVLCAVAVVAPQKTIAMPEFQDGIVILDNANVMIRPSSDSSVETTLKAGTRIGVFCEERPGWYRIIYGNYRGYMRTDTVLIPSKDKMYGYILLAELNVRAKPTNDAVSVGKVNAGCSLEITEIINGWYKIRTNGTSGGIVEGYVHQENVLITGIETSETEFMFGMQRELIKMIQKSSIFALKKE
jgi:uncharacterized protein YgiM (DUF1202 family)